METPRRKKILVVDDEEAIAELIKAKLERSNFDVYVAYDGLKGLELLSKITPDLVVLDILMPKLDGFQFLRTVRETKTVSELPVMIMTARGAMRETFEELGVNAFLVKPFEPEELLFRVQKILVDDTKDKPKKRVLIAGSDEQKTDMMSSQLMTKGYTVSVVRDGPKALGKALQIWPDLFIVQYDMPEMGADEIIGILDKFPGSEQISIVVYSIFETDREIENSPWGRLLHSEDYVHLRKKESPLSVIDKFDSQSFLHKIENFL